jgi:hypothetical protein
VSYEWRETRELRDRFIRAVYDLRDPNTGWAVGNAIMQRMGLDPGSITHSPLRSIRLCDIGYALCSWPGRDCSLATMPFRSDPSIYLDTLPARGLAIGPPLRGHKRSHAP